jgi:fatty acid desaturase
VASQVVLIAICSIAGWPQLYFLLWFAPWMTSWRVINRLRSIAEHGGMQRSNDRRLTSHTVKQSWLPSLVMVPYNIGYHLSHHVDMGVPWRNLPQLHKELVAAGYVTTELEYPSYRALWRKLASRSS